MWEKIKKWWETRQAILEQRKYREMLETEMMLLRYMEPVDPTITDIHIVPVLICSVYFEQKQEMIAVDFSQEEEGLVHFMIFTKSKIEEYNADVSQLEDNMIRTKIKNARVFMKNYPDGSGGWCFSS